MGTLSVPLKTVIMYHADTTNEPIPASYEACDGRLLGIGTHDIGGGTSTYQLPDLRNRFILGADITKGTGVVGGTTDTAADAPGPKATSGMNGTTLSIANLPAHTHSVTGSPGHTLTLPNHVHAPATGLINFKDGVGGDRNWSAVGGATDGASNSTGNPTTNPAIAGSITVGTLGTSSIGSGTTLDIRPRYYGLVFLMKVRL